MAGSNGTLDPVWDDMDRYVKYHVAFQARAMQWRQLTAMTGPWGSSSWQVYRHVLSLG